jgi:hypothetical protein
MMRELASLRSFAQPLWIIGRNRKRQRLLAPMSPFFLNFSTGQSLSIKPCSRQGNMGVMGITTPFVQASSAINRQQKLNASPSRTPFIDHKI